MFVLTRESVQPADSPKAIAVRVSGLTKRYGDLVAVRGIDFEVRQGTCMGILGPNGAGKTTTIEILEGLKQPDSGEVEVLGRSWAKDAEAIRERIGVQLQETVLTEKMTVEETVRLFRSFYARGADCSDVLELVGLTEKRAARVGDLSGGQKQRLALGCALVNEPKLLFLDEPTTGLDPQARRRVWEIVSELKRKGGTVILTTHYMDEAEVLADELVIVDHGSIVTRGTPKDIIAGLEAESVVSLVPAEGAVFDDGELGALAGVSEVRREADSIVLSVSDTQRAIGALYQFLDREGLELLDLHTHRPTLEDVFVSLTGHHLRDD